MSHECQSPNNLITDCLEGATAAAAVVCVHFVTAIPLFLVLFFHKNE